MMTVAVPLSAFLRFIAGLFFNSFRAMTSLRDKLFFGLIIAGFHCHAIKIKIENHSMNEVKKLTRYRRYINKYSVQASGLCGISYSSYLT